MRIQQLYNKDGERLKYQKGRTDFDDVFKKCSNCSSFFPYGETQKNRSVCAKCFKEKNKMYYKNNMDSFKKYYKRRNKPFVKPLIAIEQKMADEKCCAIL